MKTKSAILGLLLALAAVAAMNTAPWSRFYPLGDSAVFAYIGREMLSGSIPYRDLFDHKGPILYLIEYLGCWITPGSFTGIWILEAGNMLATLLILWKLLRVLSERISAVWTALFLTFVLCAHSLYEGGNFTEEYALPWISLAALVFFSFFKTEHYRKRDIVLLGVSFAAVFLLRANMVSVFAFLPVVLLMFLRKKQYRDILRCTLLFLLGCLIVTMPVLLYFYVHHALKDFLECYLVFNTTYSAEAASGAQAMLNLTGAFLLRMWPGVFALIYSVLVGRRDRIRWLNLLFFLISLLMAEMSGRDYPHYLISILPAFAIPFCDLSEGVISLLESVLPSRVSNRSERHETHWDLAKPENLVFLLILFLTVGAFARQVAHWPETRQEEPVERWLRENTTADSDVLVLGNSAWVYLVSDRHTGNRFFYQIPPALISDEILDAFCNELEEKPSDVIVNMAGDWGAETVGRLSPQVYSEIQLENCTVYLKQAA